MVFFTASLSFYHIKLQLKALPSADTPRAAQPPAHRLILNAPTQLQLCQLGRLGQRRKGSRAKASHGCPSRILFEALHKLINSVESQVSILAVYFSSFSISFLKMLTVSWTSRLDLSKAPEPGHLPHSCRIPHISHQHQGANPNSWLQSLPGWAELQPGLLQKLGAWSKTMQENASKKMSRTAPNISFSFL